MDSEVGPDESFTGKEEMTFHTTFLVSVSIQFQKQESVPRKTLVYKKMTRNNMRKQK